MRKIKPKRSIGTFKPPKNTMEISPENMKKITIKPARNPANFNQKRFNRHMDRMFRKRRSFKERIFPKSGWFWDGTHNGIFGPGGHTSYEFNWGKFATLLAGVIIILLIIGFIIIL